MAPADPQPLGQRFDPRLIERTLVDQPQRAIDGCARAAPGRRMLRGFRPAAQAWPETGRFRRGGAGEIPDVARLGLAHRADRPAIDPGRGDGDEDRAVERGIARVAHTFAEFEIEFG
jgi:hypothetical protein